MSKRKPKPDPNRYPPGLDAPGVKAVIAHYDKQSEDEAIAEADAAWHNVQFTLVRVPHALVAEVERLIERRSVGTAARPRRRKSA